MKKVMKGWMPGRMSAAALIALAAVAFSGAVLAATEQAAPTPPAGHPPVEAKKPAAKKPVKRPKPIDINSASRAELKKLPYITDAEADKIVAGRPYLSKADLVTSKIIPEGVYVAIKDRIIAIQKNRPLPKKK